LSFAKGSCRDKIDITWGCYGRVDGITDLDMLKLMKRAGCWRISFGTRERITGDFRFYRKGETLDQMRKVVEWTYKAGIKSKGFFMMGNVMETEKTLQQTVDFARTLKCMISRYIFNAASRLRDL